MDLKKLSDQFLVDDETGPEKLGEMIQKLLPYCVVRKNGTVDIIGGSFSGKALVKLILSARLVASKLAESSVSAEVTAEEIAAYTGLPKNQAAARAKEVVDERFAERSSRGSYKTKMHKIANFLGELSVRAASKEAE